jgi:hypothetical protein
MKFDGTGGAHSGGAATYPYYFTINGASTEIPLLCVSYQDQISQGETWTADVYTIGSSSWASARTAAEQKEDEEDAYLDSVILSSSSSTVISEAQWAAWVVGDTSHFDAPTPATPAGFSAPGAFSNMDSVLDSLGLNNVNGINEVSGINSEYEAAYDSVGNESASFYAGYEIFVPIAGSQSKGGTPQTFVGAVPEPSSLILFGSGLLTVAGALYRRKRRIA